MGRVLSTIVAVVLLLGLGALAVLALPGAGAPMTASSAAAAPLAAEPDAPAAPAALENYNLIALPLDSQAQFTAAGATWDAKGLAQFIGTGVTQVLRWDSSVGFQIWYPLTNRGTNFPLVVSGTYFVLLDSNATSNVVSFVGGVPNMGSVQYDLVGGTPCVYNSFMVPLDQSAITSETLLGQALVNAEQVLSWDANSQNWLIWYPATGRGSTFPVKVGYPYFACMAANKTWP